MQLNKFVNLVDEIIYSIYLQTRKYNNMKYLAKP